MDLLAQMRQQTRYVRLEKRLEQAVLGAMDLWDHREQAEEDWQEYRAKAWQNANTIMECMEGRTHWLAPILFGMALSNLEIQRYGHAERLFQQMPEEIQLPGYQEICRFHRTFPVGNPSYAALVPDLWEAFQKREAAITRALHTRNYSKAFPLISSVFNAQGYLPFGFSEENGVFHLQFILAEDPENIFPLLYLEEHVPPALQKKWQFRAGLELSLNQQVPISGFSYDLSQFQFTLDKAEDDQPTPIHVYNSALANLAAQDAAEAQKLAEQAVADAVGEIPARYVFHPILAEEREPRRDALPLNRLCRTRRTARKMELRMSARSYLDRSLASVRHLKPSAGLRSDIVSGFSCFPELLQEYQEGKDHIFYGLLGQGVAAGFVFYPTKPDLTDCHPILDLPQKIKAAAGNEVFVTGFAIGMQYCYLDFIAFDFLRVLAALKKVFAGIQGGEAARFASFYPGAAPTSLDADREIAAYRAAMAQIQRQR